MTIGVSPGVVGDRSEPAGRAAARSVAGGMLTPTPAGAERVRSSRARPPTPATSAPRPTAPVRRRKERRAGSEIAGFWGVTSTAAALDNSHDSVWMPTPAAIATWSTTIAGLASGSPVAATKPTTPNAANPSAASGNDRVAMRPRSAPKPSEARTTTTSSASLSLVPNRATTKSLAPGGWRSITTWPTAATSDAAPGSSPAISSEMPRARPAETAPAAAAMLRDTRRAGAT